MSCQSRFAIPGSGSRLPPPPKPRRPSPPFRQLGPSPLPSITSPHRIATPTVEPDDATIDLWTPPRPSRRIVGNTSLLPQCATSPKRRVGPDFMLGRLKHVVEDLERRFYGETTAEKRARELAEYEAYLRRPPTPPVAVLDRKLQSMAAVPELKSQAMIDHLIGIARQRRKANDDARLAALAALSAEHAELTPHLTLADFVAIQARFNELATNGHLRSNAVPPKGWTFVDRVVDAALVRKAKKKRLGFIEIVKLLYVDAKDLDVDARIEKCEAEVATQTFLTHKHMLCETIPMEEAKYWMIAFLTQDRTESGVISREAFRRLCRPSDMVNDDDIAASFEAHCSRRGDTLEMDFEDFVHALYSSP